MQNENKEAFCKSELNSDKDCSDLYIQVFMIVALKK